MTNPVFRRVVYIERFILDTHLPFNPSCYPVQFQLGITSFVVAFCYLLTATTMRRNCPGVAEMNIFDYVQRSSLAVDR